MKEEIFIQLENFFKTYNFLSFKKGETIINAEESPVGVYFLKKGYARLNSISPDGQELTLNIFKPGSYFSMMWAIAEIPNNYYFQAMTDIEVYQAPKDPTIEFLKENPEILFELTSRILVGLAGTLGTMESLLFGKANNKIASVLLTCVKRFGKKTENGQSLINLPLTHQDIANLAGLTRETTSLEMEKLVSKGLIDNRHKSIIIRDYERLEDEAQVHTSKEELPSSV